MPLPVEQDVIRFQVAVDVTQAVHGQNGNDHLRHVLNSRIALTPRTSRGKRRGEGGGGEMKKYSEIILRWHFYNIATAFTTEITGQT